MKNLEPYESDIDPIETTANSEEKLVQKWKRKGGDKVFPIALKVVKDELLLEAVDDGPSTNKHTAIAAGLCGASGSGDNLFALKLMQQYAGVLDIDGKMELAVDASNSFLRTMTALEPEDEIEGMLLTQIFSLHTLGMKCASRAANVNNSTVNVDRNVNNMTKLLRLQHEAIEKLSRYRRKGTQQVVVQHVNVNNGGKAIVSGSMEGRGEASK